MHKNFERQWGEIISIPFSGTCCLIGRPQVVITVTLHLRRRCSCLRCKHLSLSLWAFLVITQKNSGIGSLIFSLCLSLCFRVAFLFLFGLFVIVQVVANIGSFVFRFSLRGAFPFLLALFIIVQIVPNIGSFDFCLCLRVSSVLLLALFIAVEEDTRVCLGLRIPGADMSFWQGSTLLSDQKACSGRRITINRLWQS